MEAADATSAIDLRGLGANEKFDPGAEPTGTLLSTILSGRDVTWLDQYPRAVDAVTLGQVNNAIKEHLNPEKMIIVQAGTLPK
jgi:predicted Zn-dependent peptidase